MVKLGIFASILTISAALGYATVASSPVHAAGECKRSDFTTKMVKEACATGGQKAAKDAMKAWLKTAKKAEPKITGCPTCHTKVGGDYPLKKNALELFKSAGGELLDDKATPPKIAPPKTPPPSPAPSAPVKPAPTKP
jgi:hypothetical protein